MDKMDNLCYTHENRQTNADNWRKDFSNDDLRSRVPVGLIKSWDHFELYVSEGVDKAEEATGDFNLLAGEEEEAIARIREYSEKNGISPEDAAAIVRKLGTKGMHNIANANQEEVERYLRLIMDADSRSLVVSPRGDIVVSSKNKSLILKKRESYKKGFSYHA